MLIKSKWFITALAVTSIALLIKGYWLPLKAYLAYSLMEQAYVAQSMENGRGLDAGRPWPWADFSVIGKVNIKGKSTFLTNKATNEAMAFGVGKHEEQAPEEPIFISGHRDTYFNILKKIHKGEPVFIEEGGLRNKYKVTHTSIVDLRQGEVMFDSRADYILSTCWPFDQINPDTPNRYFVFLKKDEG